MSRQAVHQYEMGQSLPSLDVLNVFAGRLGIPIASLLMPDSITAEEPVKWPYAADLDLERLVENRDLRGVIARAREVLASGPSDALAAQARLYLGRSLAELGNSADAPEAIEHLQQAQLHMERLAYPWHVAEAMDWESFGTYLLGDTTRAVTLVEEALNQFRRLEPRDRLIEARMLEHLGSYRLREHAFDESITSYSDALDVSGGLLDLARLARTYHGLFIAEWSVARPEDHARRHQAVERGRTAVQLYRTDVERRPDIDQVPLARIENDLAVALMDLGRLDEADSFLSESIRRLEAAHEEHVYPFALITMSEIRQRQGRTAEAFEPAMQALHLARRIGEVVAQADALRQLALLHGENGDYVKMDQHYQLAIRVLEDAALTAQRDEYVAAYLRLRAGGQARHQHQG